jgi:hypothetical protein
VYQKASVVYVVLLCGLQSLHNWLETGLLSVIIVRRGLLRDQIHERTTWCCNGKNVEIIVD